MTTDRIWTGSPNLGSGWPVGSVVLTGVRVKVLEQEKRRDVQEKGNKPECGHRASENAASEIRV